MKIKKELRKRVLITIRPSTQARGSKLAFKNNLSLSRLVEILIEREIEAQKSAKA